MLSVSQAVLDALVAPTRKITSKVLVYFDATPLMFTGEDYIAGFSSLEEEYYDGATLFGLLSSNECSIRLWNKERIFSVTNAASPLYGKLLPGVKVEVFAVVHTPSPVDVPIGTFYTSEWPINAKGTFVDVVCRDRLNTASKISLEPTELHRNISVKDAITYLFDSAGVTNYTVDNSLTYVIPYWTYTATTLGAELQKFITGYGCRIYVNKSNIITVIRAREATVVDTFTGANQIIDLTSGSDPRYIYSSLNIKYRAYRPSEDLLLSVSVEAGTNEFVFNQPNVAIVTNIKSDTIITSITYDSNKITIIADSNGTVECYGVYLISSIEQQIVNDAALQLAVGSISRDVNTEVVQSASEAVSLASLMFSYVTSMENLITVDARGNVALELGDRILVNNDSSKTNALFYVTKIHYEFDGSLKARYTLLKAADVEAVWLLNEDDIPIVGKNYVWDDDEVWNDDNVWKD
jgi:hypothetical protein